MIIHDLNSELADKLLAGTKESCIIADHGDIHNCIGCFGCWIKTPGVCVIKDEYANMGELLGKTSELLIISKCFYGGYSPFVKNILDRSISYIHPYFAYRNGEMHHKRRYDNIINLKVYFYGDEITEQEKETARNLIKANEINLDCRVKEVRFLTMQELMEGNLC